LLRGYAVWVLAALNVVILGLTVVYAVNARAQFIFEATRFEYFDITNHGCRTATTSRGHGRRLPGG
jgi:hypothetical protein